MPVVCPECEAIVNGKQCKCGWRADVPQGTHPRGWEPSCVRCKRPMPGYKARYGLCATCLEHDFHELQMVAEGVASGRIPKVDPKYLPAGVSRGPAGPLWTPEQLTPKAIAARKQLGLPIPGEVERPGSHGAPF